MKGDAKVQTKAHLRICCLVGKPDMQNCIRNLIQKLRHAASLPAPRCQHALRKWVTMGFKVFWVKGFGALDATHAVVATRNFFHPIPLLARQSLGESKGMQTSQTHVKLELKL